MAIFIEKRKHLLAAWRIYGIACRERRQGIHPRSSLSEIPQECCRAVTTAPVSPLRAATNVSIPITPRFLRGISTKGHGTRGDAPAISAILPRFQSKRFHSLSYRAPKRFLRERIDCLIEERIHRSSGNEVQFLLNKLSKLSVTVDGR